MDTVRCDNGVTFDYKLFNQWKNSSSLNSVEQLQKYICLYREVMDFMTNIRYALGYVECVCAFFGFVGTILTILTIFYNPNFSARSFFYFRVIALLEVMVTTFLFTEGISFIWVDGLSTSYVFLWIMTRIVHALINLFGSTIHLLTMFLSVERAVACLMPNQYQKISRPFVAYYVLTAILALATAMFVPSMIDYNIAMNPGPPITYSKVPAKLRDTDFYKGYSTFVDTTLFCFVGAVALSTGFAVFGLMQALHHRQSVTNRVGDSNAPNQTQRNNDQVHLQLCYLQISQAVPSSIQYLFFAIVTCLSSRALAIGLTAISSKPSLDFVSVMSNLNLRYYWEILRFLSYSTDNLAHTVHFYVYVTFSQKFRQGFLQRYRDLRNKLSGQQATVREVSMRTVSTKQDTR